MSVANKTILLVDNDIGSLQPISAELAAAGYSVNAVDSAEKALVSITARPPHVIVTEARVSGMEGFAWFDAFHKIYPEIPVIMLTAHGSVAEAFAAARKGLFAYLEKPADHKTLLVHVLRALSAGGGAAASEPGGETSDWRAGFVVGSTAMEDLLARARLVAVGSASVFIFGESGSGKEMLAKAIHKASPRREKPFVAVNCAAIPEQLLESELFGYLKGAFTGAIRDHPGLFLAANGGTLFLDEIGDTPLPIQVKLLRVLQEQEVRPVGTTESIKVDVRIISASHRDLVALKAAGKFREDLYYRLNVVSLQIPPLSARREDIPLLAAHFLKHFARLYGKPTKAFSVEALDLLVSATWPGNVRQLQNVIEQSVALCTTFVIPATFVEQAIQLEVRDYTSFADARNHFERDYLVQLLKITHGNVSHAARLAQRHRTEFYRMLKRHHIDPSRFKTR